MRITRLAVAAGITAMTFTLVPTAVQAAPSYPVLHSLAAGSSPRWPTRPRHRRG